MELHFYTTWRNVEKLWAGKEINVWLKYVASNMDVHISLNKAQYDITPTDTPHLFNVISENKMLKRKI